MTITPVTPVDREQLVPTTTGILFDSTESIVSVTVNGLLVWSLGVPQNSWLGFTITHPGGTRFVLDAPAAFAVGAKVTVVITGGVTAVTYVFAVGLRQITTTDDASVPRLVEGGPVQPPAVTPLIHLPFNDASGPPVDAQGNHVFTQLGAPVFQQAGIIPGGTAIALNGTPDALTTSSVNTTPTITERAMIITNPTGSVMTAVSVRFVLDTAALVTAEKMDADSGIRLLTSADAAVPYWVEGPANTGATVYWAKVTLQPGANTFKIRFCRGQNFKALHEDKENVFLFFDDFEDGSFVVGSKWSSVGSGAYTESGGNLNGGNTNQDVISVTTFNEPVVMTTKSVETAAATNGFSSCGFYRIASDALFILSHNTTSFYYNNGSYVNYAFNALNTGEVTDEVTVTATQGRIKRTRAAESYDSGFFAVSGGMSNEPVYLGGRPDFRANQSYSMSWRHVYVRKYLVTEPTVAFGADSSAGLGNAVPPLPDPLKLSKFSISGWFNANSVGAQRALASSGRAVNKGWVLRLLATNTVEFRAFDGVTSSAATSSTVVGAGQWHHVVMCVDVPNNVFRLYMNSSKEVDVDPAITAILFEALGASNTDDLWLGRDVADATSYWQGRLDQWRYFANIVLTDGQVSQLFQESTGAQRPPWIGYSKAPGNIVIRKDEPLAGEVTLVPGDKVDIGYDEINNEIEIVYIHNGKVFLITGQAHDTPSTLTQPSILKNDVTTGDVGTWEQSTFTKADFPPIKLAVPIEPTIMTGDIGSYDFASHTAPPNTAGVSAFFGSPALVVVGPASSPLITTVSLFKRAFGAVVFLAEFPGSANISVYLDYAYVEGDAYLTQSTYGDPGALARKRLTEQSNANVATPGDLITTGDIGTWELTTFTSSDFPPLKYAIPIEPTITTGDIGSSGDTTVSRRWFPPNAGAASMGVSLDGFIVISGLTNMTAQHLGLNVNISGAANALNNGAWPIIEIISATSVRVDARAAAGNDANNGALTWTITGTMVFSPASFIAVNTINIGVG